MTNLEVETFRDRGSLFYTNLGMVLFPTSGYLLYLLPIIKLYRRVVAKGKYKDGPYDS